MLKKLSIPLLLFAAITALSCYSQFIINPFTFGAPPLVFADLGNVNNTTDATSKVTGASYQPAGNSLVLAFTWQTHGTAVVTPTSFTGNGITWTLLNSVNSSGNLAKLAVWYGSAASPTSGTGTVQFNQTATGGGIRVVEFRDADISGGVASAIVQSVTNSGTGANPTLTLAALGGGGKNATIYFILDNVNSTTDNSDSEGKTEIFEVSYNTPTTGCSGYRQMLTTDNTMVHTATARTWCGIALEIKAKQ